MLVLGHQVTPIVLFPFVKCTNAIVDPEVHLVLKVTSCHALKDTCTALRAIRDSIQGKAGQGDSDAYNLQVTEAVWD